jgi:hypothetical protein
MELIDEKKSILKKSRETVPLNTVVGITTLKE